MPNHYTNHLIIMPGVVDDDLVDIGKVLGRFHGEGADDFFAEVHPMPADIRDAPNQGINPPWYQWAMENWGTKWGAYDVMEPVQLCGDSFCWTFTFETAWSPPHEEMRGRVIDWLKANGAESVTWIGVEPYDNTVVMVQEATHHPTAQTGG